MVTNSSLRQLLVKEVGERTVHSLDPSVFCKLGANVMDSSSLLAVG